MSILKTSLYSVITLSVALGIGYYWGKIYHDKKEVEIKKANQLIERVDYIPEIEEIIVDSINEPDNFASIDTSSNHEVTMDKFPSIEDSKVSYIISISAYSKLDQANAHVNQLLAKGLCAKSIWIPNYQSNGKKLHKVYLGVFDSYDNANKYLIQHKITQEAYIQKINRP